MLKDLNEQLKTFGGPNGPVVSISGGTIRGVVDDDYGIYVTYANGRRYFIFTSHS